MQPGLRCIFRPGGPFPPLPEGDFSQDPLETSCSENDLFGQCSLLQLSHEADLPNFYGLLWICSSLGAVGVGFGLSQIGDTL